MWNLDRLSAHPTPSASPAPQQLRQTSPVPYRQNPTAQRPSLATRSSSLSLASVPSSVQLPSSARINPGSSLKNSISNEPPTNVEDPLAALGRILGASENGTSETHTGNIAQDDALASLLPPFQLQKAINFTSNSLQGFVDLQGATGGANGGIVSQGLSTKSAEEFEKDRSNFEELHKSIQRCDNLLDALQQYLTQFQENLSTVSAEIENLQSRSIAMNEKLATRQKVEASLRPVVTQVTLSPVTVRVLSEGSVDDNWVHALDDLQNKIKVLESGKSDSAATKAAADLRPLLQNITNKAVERIRDYFATRIKSLRSPNINAQIIQQRDFLRRRALFAFLATHQPQLAEDISHAYTNTMRWYYHMHFVRYDGALQKLRLHRADKTDLVGEDPLARTAAGSKLPGHAPLSLGRRSEMLRNAPNGALPASTAEESKAPTYIEAPYFFFNLALLDNACFEYSFLATFHPPGSPLGNAKSIARQFEEIFSPVLEMGQALTRSLTADSFDALGVLLMIRITQHFAFVLQRRKVPAMDSYINGANMALWPRFQAVIDAHCESIKRLTSSIPTRAAGAGAGGAATLASLSGAGGAAGGSRSTAPQPVTQRFAQLLQGILELSSEAGDDEPVANSLGRLRSDFEGLLQRMAGGFGAGERGRKEKDKFLGNNYALVLTIIAEVQGSRLAEASREHFQRLVGRGAA